MYNGEPGYDDDNIGGFYNSEESSNSTESGYHFQEPDISIVGDDFQPINKKYLGYPGRDGKLENLEKMDLSTLRTNLRKVRDGFDKALATEGNNQDAIYSLNHTEERNMLLQTPDFKVGLSTIKISGLSIYASNFHIKNDSDLYFTLIIGIDPTTGPVNINSLYNYFDFSKIACINKDTDTIHINNVPCNEPIVTEYASAFFYSYKQLVKFLSHKYGYQKKDKENTNSGMKNKIEIQNIEDNENLFLETMDAYLLKNNPGLKSKRNTKYSIGVCGLGEIKNISFFELKAEFRKLTIIFHNTPFEIAEYWYGKILESTGQVNKIIHSKFNLDKMIKKTKENLLSNLVGNGGNDGKLTTKTMELVDIKIKRHQENGDNIESPIFIQYIKDALKFKRHIELNDILNIENDSYYKIIDFYKNLFKDLIIDREGGESLEKISPNKEEQKIYIIRMLDLINEISIIKPNEDGIRKILSFFGRADKNDFENIQTYKLVYKTIIKWLENSNHEEFLLGITCNFAKNVLYREDMPYLFNLISKGNGDNIEKHINKCINYFIGLLPAKLVDLIENILWQYCFTTTVQYLNITLKENIEDIDLSLLDQFAYKDVYTDKIRIDNNLDINKNEYRTNSRPYHRNMIDSMKRILEEKETFELRSLAHEELKKQVIGLLYTSFLSKYRQENISPEYSTIFMNYFSDEQKIELEKEKLKNQFRKCKEIIKEIINTGISEDKKMFENESEIFEFDKLSEILEDEDISQNKLNSKSKKSHVTKSILEKISFYEVDQRFEELEKYCDEKEISEYKRDFQNFIIDFVLKTYYDEILENVDIEIDEEKLNKILSFISEKEKAQFIKTVEAIKVKIWVEKDSEAIKSGEIDIDTSKYQGINIENKKNKEKIKELVIIKQKQDKKYIIENKEVDIESIINWYNIWKGKFPDLVEKIITNLENIHTKGDKTQRLFTSFDEIEKAIKEKELQDFHINEFIKAFEYYIDSLCIDIENLGEKERKILQKSLGFIFYSIYTKENKLKDLRKIINFLSNAKSISGKEKKLLKNLLELYDLEKNFSEKDLKYIHVLIGITNNLINIDTNMSDAISDNILKHIIEIVEILDKNNELSYEQMEKIVDKIKNGPMGKHIEPMEDLENSKFVMMLKYV